MRDGTECHYNYHAGGWLYLLTSCVDTFNHTFLEITRTGGVQGTTTFRQNLIGGQFREVVYAPGPGGTRTLSFNGRTWTYAFDADGRITSATPPVGPAWTFGYATQVGDPSYPYMTYLETPGGGRIDYTYENVYEQHLHPESGQWYMNNHGRFLKTRTVSGPLPTASGVWTLKEFFFGAPERSIPSTFVIESPSGTITSFLNCTSGTNKLIVGPGLGTCGIANHLRVDEHIDEAIPFKTYLSGVRLWRYRRNITWNWDCQALNTSCVKHETHYQYDPFVNPTQILEINPQHGVQRVTTRTYLNDHGAMQTVNFVGVLTSESVTVGSETFTRSWSLDPMTRFRQSETAGGITTTFQPDGHGNVASATTATGKTTSYTYDWGVVKNTQTPMYTVTRAINPDGTVESETQGSFTTEYEYDNLGRRTETRGPGGEVVNAKVTTTYNDAARTVTTQRGPSSVTTTMDGFGRPIGTINSAGVQTRTQYDAEGRKVYQSLPFGPGVAESGTDFTYDIIHRVLRETHGDGTYRERTYLNSDVVVRDEENRVTTIRRQTFGHPDDGRVTQVVDAAGQAWNYAYNVRDSLTSVAGPGGVTRTWTYTPGSYLLDTETHPESGEVEYDYDAAGVLETKDDARGTSFVYGYDNNNRVTSITATPQGGPAQTTTITYVTGTDRRDVTTVAGASTDLDYDAAGRVWKRTDTVDGKSFQTAFSYDNRDNLTEVVYPSGRSVGYEYDGENRITRVFNVTTGQNYASTFSYHPSGAVTGYTSGNGLVTTLTYKPHRYWLASVTAGPLSLGYEYDGVGNIELITDSRPAMGQAFLYDALDRLYHAVGLGLPGSYPEQAFAYDAHGNRQSTATTTYAYHAGNPFRLQSINGNYSLQYDANGNLTTGFGGTYDYTPDNLLDVSSIGGTTARFTYDADAWRVKKAVDGGAATYYSRGPTGQMLTEWVNTSPTSTVRDYIYAGGRLIAVATKKLPAK